MSRILLPTIVLISILAFSCNNEKKMEQNIENYYTQTLEYKSYKPLETSIVDTLTEEFITSERDLMKEDLLKLEKQKISNKKSLESAQNLIQSIEKQLGHEGNDDNIILELEQTKTLYVKNIKSLTEFLQGVDERIAFLNASILSDNLLLEHTKNGIAGYQVFHRFYADTRVNEVFLRLNSKFKVEF